MSIRFVALVACDHPGCSAVGEVPAISVLLAVRHGYLVFEQYYNGHMAEDPINVRSVTKSVTSTLAGAALRTGLLSGLDARTGDLIPNRIPADHDPLVEDTTLWQWLTMTSGLQWDERPCFERFSAATAMDPATGEFSCEICIPVRPL